MSRRPDVTREECDYVHEYRVIFPVGVDAHEEGNPTPVTFGRYGMRGTPTLLLIDRDGVLRAHYFGAVDDMEIASAVTRLIDAESAQAPETVSARTAEGSSCTVDGVCS